MKFDQAKKVTKMHKSPRMAEMAANGSDSLNVVHSFGAVCKKKSSGTIIFQKTQGHKGTLNLGQNKRNN